MQSSPLFLWAGARPHEPCDVGGRGHPVRVVGRSIPPPWWSIRCRLALRTYDAPPCGPSVRVMSQRKSGKIPTLNILPPFFLIRYYRISQRFCRKLVQQDALGYASRSVPRPRGLFDFALLSARTMHPPWGVRVVPDRQTKSIKIPTHISYHLLPKYFKEIAIKRNRGLHPIVHSARGLEPLKKGEIEWSE